MTILKHISFFTIFIAIIVSMIACDVPTDIESGLTPSAGTVEITKTVLFNEIRTFPTSSATVSALTSTPIVIPIDNIDREKAIRDLMLSNGNCELPCWWGINYGQI